MAYKKTCQVCNKPFTGRVNSKQCEPCKTKIRQSYGCIPTLDDHTQRLIRDAVGRLSTKEMAEALGLSRSTVKRFLISEGISNKRDRYDKRTIERVLAYYETHGKIGIEKKFPGVRWRTIVEHNEYKKRQTRWTDREFIKAVRMAGIVPYHTQADIFKRPGARAGSITSLWQKRIKARPNYVNGLPIWLAKGLIKEGCPVYQLPMRTKSRTDSQAGITHHMVLWIDIAKYCRADVESNVKQCIKVMAKFQRFLHRGRVRHNLNRFLEYLDEHQVDCKSKAKQTKYTRSV